MSSLKEHFERVRAERLAKSRDTRGVVPTPPVATHDDVGEHDDGLAPIELRFFNDSEQLSAIVSHLARHDKKRELLPNYTGYIDGVIASGVGVQNDMLLTLMVWCLDVGELDRATDIAQFALLNDMVMPEPFTTSIATVYAREFAQQVIKEPSLATSELVYRAVHLTDDYDMPDEVRAKLYRALGDVIKQDAPKEAMTAYETALRLDDKVGVKGELNALKKTLSE